MSKCRPECSLPHVPSLELDSASPDTKTQDDVRFGISRSTLRLWRTIVRDRWRAVRKKPLRRMRHLCSCRGSSREPHVLRLAVRSAQEQAELALTPTEPLGRRHEADKPGSGFPSRSSAVKSHVIEMVGE